MDLSILLLRCKIKKNSKDLVGMHYDSVNSGPDTLQQYPFIPVEVVPLHNKGNTPITRSFYSSVRSWSTAEQNTVFLIWILAAKSWRSPQNTRLEVRGSSLVPFPHFHEGAVTRLSIMGTGSQMQKLVSSLHLLGLQDRVAQSPISTNPGLTIKQNICHIVVTVINPGLPLIVLRTTRPRRRFRPPRSVNRKCFGT